MRWTDAMRRRAPAGARVAAALVAGALALPMGSPVGSPVPAFAAGGANSWRQDGNDAGRSGYQPTTTGLTAANAGTLRVAWQRSPSAGEGFTGAVLANGILYLAETGGVVRRFTASAGLAGTVLISAPGQVFGQLALIGHTLFVASTPSVATSGPGRDVHYLAAYSLSGNRRWQIRLPDARVVTPFVVAGGAGAGGRVVVTTGPECHDLCTGFSMRAYRPDTGAALWSAPVDGDAYRQPPVADGGLAVQSAYGPIDSHGNGGALTYAYRLADGTLAWRRIGGYDPGSAGGSVYASGDSGLCAYTLPTGAKRWCQAGGGSFFERVALTPGAVFTGEPADRLERRQPADGSLVWQTGYGRGFEHVRLAADLVTGGGVVYALLHHWNVDTNERELTEVVAVRADTGHLLRRVTLDVGLSTGYRVLLGAGRLYVVGDASVWALRA